MVGASAVTAHVQRLGVAKEPRDLEDLVGSSRLVGSLEVPERVVDSLGERSVLGDHPEDGAQNDVTTIGDPDLVTEIVRSAGPVLDPHDSKSPASLSIAMVCSTSLRISSTSTE